MPVPTCVCIQEGPEYWHRYACRRTYIKTYMSYLLVVCDKPSLTLARRREPAHPDSNSRGCPLPIASLKLQTSWILSGLSLREVRATHSHFQPRSHPTPTSHTTPANPCTEKLRPARLISEFQFEHSPSQLGPMGDKSKREPCLRNFGRVQGLWGYEGLEGLFSYWCVFPFSGSSCSHLMFWRFVPVVVLKVYVRFAAAS